MKTVTQYLKVRVNIPETDDEEGSVAVLLARADGSIYATVTKEERGPAWGQETFWRVYEDDTQCVSVVHGRF